MKTTHDNLSLLFQVDVFHSCTQRIPASFRRIEINSRSNNYDFYSEMCCCFYCFAACQIYWTYLAILHCRRSADLVLIRTWLSLEAIWNMTKSPAQAMEVAKLFMQVCLLDPPIKQVPAYERWHLVASLARRHVQTNYIHGTFVSRSIYDKI